MQKTNSFIDKGSFKTLAGCIFVVEIFTESIKQLVPDIKGVWLAFFFSVLVSLIKIIVDDKYKKEDIIMALVNIMPIFLGSIGIYETIVKAITEFIN